MKSIHVSKLAMMPLLSKEGAFLDSLSNKTSNYSNVKGKVDQVAFFSIENLIRLTHEDKTNNFDKYPGSKRINPPRNNRNSTISPVLGNDPLPKIQDNETEFRYDTMYSNFIQEEFKLNETDTKKEFNDNVEDNYILDHNQNDLNKDLISCNFKDSVSMQRKNHYSRLNIPSRILYTESGSIDIIPITKLEENEEIINPHVGYSVNQVDGNNSQIQSSSDSFEKNKNMTKSNDSQDSKGSEGSPSSHLNYNLGKMDAVNIIDCPDDSNIKIVDTQNINSPKYQSLDDNLIHLKANLSKLQEEKEDKKSGNETAYNYEREYNNLDINGSSLTQRRFPSDIYLTSETSSYYFDSLICDSNLNGSFDYAKDFEGINCIQGEVTGKSCNNDCRRCYFDGIKESMKYAEKLDFNKNEFSFPNVDTKPTIDLGAKDLKRDEEDKENHKDKNQAAKSMERPSASFLGPSKAYISPYLIKPCPIITPRPLEGEWKRLKEKEKIELNKTLLRTEIKNRNNKKMKNITLKNILMFNNKSTHNLNASESLCYNTIGNRRHGFYNTRLSVSNDGIPNRHTEERHISSFNEVENQRSLSGMKPSKFPSRNPQSNITQLGLKREMNRASSEAYEISPGGSVRRRCPFKLLQSKGADRGEHEDLRGDMHRPTMHQHQRKPRRKTIEIRTQDGSFILVIPSKAAGREMDRRTKDDGRTTSQFCREEKQYWLAERKRELKEEETKRYKMSVKRSNIQHDERSDDAAANALKEKLYEKYE